MVFFIEFCAVKALASKGWPTVSLCGGRTAAGVLDIL